MRRGIAIAIMVCLLTPSAFAASTKSPEEPWFGIQRIVKRLIKHVLPLDEILTGSKP